MKNFVKELVKLKKFIMCLVLILSELMRLGDCL